MRSKSIYAVIEVNGDDIINRDVSGWYFENYNKALEVAGKMNAANDRVDDKRVFLVITLLRGESWVQ